MFKITFTQRVMISLAILVVAGVLVHDTKFDKALALALPVVAIGAGFATQTVDLGGSAHTHVERVSAEKTNFLMNGLPRVQPRDDRRRFLLPKHELGAKSTDSHTLILTPYLA